MLVSEYSQSVFVIFSEKGLFEENGHRCEVLLEEASVDRWTLSLTFLL